jgi:hypothetical protein
MTFEDYLAIKFAPTYISSAGEDRYLVELEPQTIPKVSLGHPPWKPCIYYSVFKHGTTNDQVYEINYLSIWDRDTGGPLGVEPHIWDTERTAILVEGPAKSKDPANFDAKKIFYARHGFMDEYQDAKKKDRGATVYWSLGKHASYPTYPSFIINRIDTIVQPEVKAEPSDCILKNAGTIDKPSECAPWIGYKDKWGPDGVSSVFWKLRDHLWRWDSEIGQWIPDRPVTIMSTDQIKFMQIAWGLKSTGTIDRDFMVNAYSYSPELLRFAASMGEDQFLDIAQRKPKKLSPNVVDSILNVEVPLHTVIDQKEINGEIAGINKAKAVALGQIGPKTIIYGLIHPEDSSIFEVRSASIKTIMQNKISPSDLKRLPKVSKKKLLLDNAYDRSQT